jgi:hypothetical protein
MKFTFILRLNAIAASRRPISRSNHRLMRPSALRSPTVDISSARYSTDDQSNTDGTVGLFPAG